MSTIVSVQTLSWLDHYSTSTVLQLCPHVSTPCCDMLVYGRLLWQIIFYPTYHMVDTRNLPSYIKWKFPGELTYPGVHYSYKNHLCRSFHAAQDGASIQVYGWRRVLSSAGRIMRLTQHRLHARSSCVNCLVFVCACWRARAHVYEMDLKLCYHSFWIWILFRTSPFLVG